MAFTGTKVDTAGIYKPSCGHEECAVNKGSELPPCPTCKKPVNWTLVRPTR